MPRLRFDVGGIHQHRCLLQSDPLEPLHGLYRPSGRRSQPAAPFSDVTAAPPLGKSLPPSKHFCDSLDKEPSFARSSAPGRLILCSMSPRISRLLESAAPLRWWS